MLLLLAAFIAPTAFWIGYLYYKDRFQPEPLRVVWIAYLLGIASGWLCVGAYRLVEMMGAPQDPLLLAETDRAAFLAYCIVVVGILEEACKMLPLVLVLIHLRHFDEVLDGIVYASAIALGFATYENFFYLPLLDGFERWGRAIASPLVHTIFSSIWGYTIASAVLSGRRVLPAAVAGLGVAALLHGAYDFFTLNPALRLGAALVILVIWAWRIRTIERLHGIRATNHP